MLLFLGGKFRFSDQINQIPLTEAITCWFYHFLVVNSPISVGSQGSQGNAFRSTVPLMNSGRAKLWKEIKWILQKKVDAPLMPYPSFGVLNFPFLTGFSIINHLEISQVGWYSYYLLLAITSPPATVAAKTVATACRESSKKKNSTSSSSGNRRRRCSTAFHIETIVVGKSSLDPKNKQCWRVGTSPRFVIHL